MLIEIKKVTNVVEGNSVDKIIYEIDGKSYDFTFENLNNLIELLLAEKSEIQVKCDDKNNENYEKLLNSIITEIKKPDFIALVEKLNSELTNEQILEILSPKTETN